MAPLRASLLVLPLICTSCEPTSYYVTGLQVDRAWHLIPVGSRSMRHPNKSSYYFFFHTATGLTLVHHLANQAGRTDAVRVLYLEAKNNVLDRTVKTDEILRGAFGGVYAEKTCYFARPVTEGYSAVAVRVGSVADRKLNEVATQLGGWPRS
jgi:hypothetical protein